MIGGSFWRACRGRRLPLSCWPASGRWLLALPLLERGEVDAVSLGAGLPWFEASPARGFSKGAGRKLVVILVLGKDGEPGRDPASAPEEFPCLPQNFAAEELVAVITNAIRAARGLAEPAGSLAPSPTFSAHQLWIPGEKAQVPGEGTP